jgi:beta-lactamase class A
MRRWLVFVMLALLLAPSGANAKRHPSPSPSPSPTVSPTPSPTPLSEAARFDRLRRDVAAISAKAPGRLGIAVIDLKQLSRFSARGDEAFPLAGIAQLPIAVLAYRRADQHTFGLDRRVPIAPADLRRGPSPITAMHPHGGVTLTNGDLLRAMLVDGDTTAADVLLGELGGPRAVDAFLTKATGGGFDVRKSQADLYADAAARRTFARGGDNGATPNALANLLLGIASLEYTHLDTTTELLELLSQSQRGAHRLRAGLPADADFVHEPGTSDTFDGITDATNDAGIYTLPDGRRVVIVALLAESRADLPTREAVLADVARAVTRAYVP